MKQNFIGEVTLEDNDILSVLNEVRFEIARLNRSFGETVFNPAVTQMVEATQQALRKVQS